MTTARLVRAATSVTLGTVPNVELLEVGIDWECSTGTFTFTEDDLASAVASQADPGVRSPIVKLGHTDPRFDGEPALGRVINMRTTNGGMTLVGDIVGMPAWLADGMPTMFPRRSIEGAFDFESRTDHTWPFILTALALLGAAYPAISTLEDIEALWSNVTPQLVPVEDDDETVEAPVAAGLIRATNGEDMALWKRRNTDGTVVDPAAASGPQVAAALGTVDPGDIVDAYYDEINTPEYYWWWVRELLVQPTELIVDDDEGCLYRVAYTLNTDGTITFGEPVQVAIQYVDVVTNDAGVQVAARAPLAEGQLVARRFENPVAASRPRVRPEKPVVSAPPVAATEPSTVPTHEDVPSTGGRDVQLTPEQRMALGLADDATDEQIIAALNAKLIPATGETPPEGTPATPPATPATPATPETPAVPADPDTPETAAVPEGMVLVDAATWDQVREGAQAGANLAEEAKVAARNRTLDDAVKAGKFPKSRREHYEALMSADPVGTGELISKLAAGVIPVEERGYQGGDTDTDVAASGAYPESWNRKIPVAATAEGRIRVMGD